MDKPTRASRHRASYEGDNAHWLVSGNARLKDRGGRTMTQRTQGQISARR